MPNLFYSKSVDLQNMCAIFDEHEMKHFLVLRIKEGDEIKFTDGNGRIFYGILTKMDGKKHFAKAKIISFETYEKIRDRSIGLCLPFSKWKRLKFIVEKSVELGVDFFIACKMERSNVKISKEKLDLFVRNAIKQSENPFFPDISFMKRLEDVLKWCHESAVLPIYLSKQGENPKNFLKNMKSKRILLIAGPEGGFSNSESNLLKKSADGIDLGIRTLRFETALLTALIVISYEMNNLWNLKKIF